MQLPEAKQIWASNQIPRGWAITFLQQHRAKDRDALEIGMVTYVRNFLLFEDKLLPGGVFHVQVWLRRQ